jgi:hypothetical protein
MVPPWNLLRRESLPATLLSIVLASILIVACGDPAPTPDIGQQPAETAASVPEATAPELVGSPSPPFCVERIVDGAYGPTPVAEILVERIHLIVQGTVIAILPGRWTTEDGSRPVDPGLTTGNREATIITPVVVQLDGPPIVNRLPPESPLAPVTGTVVLAALGGQVGQDCFDPDDHKAYYEVGERVLVGLTHTAYDRPSVLVPTEAGLAWSVSFKYTLTVEGQAVLPPRPDGPLSIPTAELIANLVAAAGNLPAVNPTPPIVPTSVVPTPFASPPIPSTTEPTPTSTATP